MKKRLRSIIERRLALPKPPKKHKDQACTNCGGSGHNALTCPIPKNAPKPDVPISTMRKPAKREHDPGRALTPELRAQARREAQVGAEFWMRRA